jgi:hypothetical protein
MLSRMSLLRRFDAWWKEDAATVCNGFVLLAAMAWVYLLIEVVIALIHLVAYFA